jgi:hypothetical protein
MSTCSACSLEIPSGSEVLAGDRPFHFECFHCAICGTFLSGKTFTVRPEDHKAYCESDFIAQFAPHCAKCDTPIVSDSYEALNKYYHAECFGCFTCSAKFPDGKFFVYQNQPYCVHHYSEASGINIEAEVKEKEKVSSKLEELRAKAAAKKAAPKYHPKKDVYTLDELKDVGTLHPEVDRTTREQLLSDEDFEHYFKMSKAAFLAEKKWKQDKLKKDVGIF